MATPTPGDHQSDADAQFQMQRTATTAQLTITGLLSGPHVQYLQELLDWLTGQNLSNITLNLDVSAGVGSAVLRLLRSARDDLRRRGAELVAFSVDPHIMNELVLTGLTASTATNAGDWSRSE